ncbi:hypothetical protein H8D29_00090 [PVC group bacterium]|nr:hypothetical protein [PVC group bacterium]
MKLILTIELDVDEVFYGTSKEEINWLKNGILFDECKEGLYLHSNEIGDEVGSIKVLKIEDKEEVL